MVTIKKVVSFAPNRLGNSAGTSDSETTTPLSASRTLASGVSSPIKSKIPHAITKQHPTHVEIVGLEWPDK